MLASVGFSADARTVVAVGHVIPVAEGGRGGPPIEAEVRPVEVRRYDATTGALLGRATLVGLDGRRLSSCLLAPDGTAAFAGNEYGKEFARYDTSTGKVTWSVTSEREYFSAVAVSGNGQTVAAIAFNAKTRGYTTRILDATTGKDRASIPGTGRPIWGLALSPDGKAMVAVVGGEKADIAAELWDLARSAVHSIPKGALDKTGLVAFSPDGKRFAIGDENRVVVYDAATSNAVTTLEVSAYSCGFAFTADGSALAVPRCSMGLWDSTTGRLRPQSADFPGSRAFDKLTFSADGTTLTAYGMGTPQVAAWEVAGGRVVTQLSGTHADEIAAKFTTIGRLAPGGRYVVRMAGGAQIVEEVATGRQVRSFRVGRFPYEYQCATSADGRYLFGWNGTKVVQWEVITGAKLGTLVDDTDIGTIPDALDSAHLTDPIAYPSPCGRYVAVVPGRWPKRAFPISIFDAATRKVVGEFTGYGHPSLVGWAADGNRLAVVCKRSMETLNPLASAVAVWEVPSGRVVVRSAIPDAVRIHDFSPDLRTLLASSAEGLAHASPLFKSPHDVDQSVRLYEVVSGQLRHRFGGADPWSEVGAFSPNGRFLASAHINRPVLIWDTRVNLAGPRTPLDAAGLERAWVGLGSADARTGFEAIRTLAANPGESVPLLKRHIRPAAVPNREMVQALIDSLDDGDFQKRDRATVELGRLGKVVGLQLREASATTRSAEVRKRVAALLGKIDAAVPTLDELRSTRAVEALEWMDAREAIELLEAWSAGSEIAPLTIEAKLALARLNKK